MIGNRHGRLMTRHVGNGSYGTTEATKARLMVCIRSSVKRQGHKWPVKPAAASSLGISQTIRPREVVPGPQRYKLRLASARRLFLSSYLSRVFKLRPAPAALTEWLRSQGAEVLMARARFLETKRKSITHSRGSLAFLGYVSITGISNPFNGDQD